MFGPFCELRRSKLRPLLAKFEQHYNRERYHQRPDVNLVMPNLLAVYDNGTVAAMKTHSRLGRVLNFYHREAA